jgi:hypothetical protein
VAVETTFQDLVTRVRALRDAMASLQITAVEDRPLSGGVLLVERIGNTVDDLRGLAEEALEAAAEALRAVGHPLDEYGARNALAEANRRFICLEYKFLADEISCEQLNELTKFGRGHGHEWRGWIGSVLHALTQCRGPVHDVDNALLLAWQDLSERIGAGGVSVRTTNIGQISASPGRTSRRENCKPSGVADETQSRSRN